MANLTGTTTATAITAGTCPPNDDNPFLLSLPYDHLMHAEQPSQLEGQLRTLSIRSPESLPVDQSDANNTSEASAVCQRRRNDAQDVKAFFREENGRRYCKFCEYVFHPSMTVTFLTCHL